MSPRAKAPNRETVKSLTVANGLYPAEHFPRKQRNIMRGDEREIIASHAGTANE